MPFFWKTLAPAGMVLGNPAKGSRVTVRNDKWFSYPGYSEILTGQAQPDVKSNDFVRYPHKTVLEHVQAELGLGFSEVAQIGSWDGFKYAASRSDGGFLMNGARDALPAELSTPMIDLLVDLRRQVMQLWEESSNDVLTYRIALESAGSVHALGLYGFGAAAHILCQVAVHDGLDVYAFTRAGDDAGQRFARQLGATWAGSSDETPPVALDAAILFAPVGALVPASLAAVAPGGVVVTAGIHMSDIPSFPYRLLWQERIVRSVANLTREDGRDFMVFRGRARIDAGDEARKRVYESAHPFEQSQDKDRKGNAMIIELDSVEGFFGGALLKMKR